MTEQPIIFTAESVRAILSDTKTQTRRLRGLKAINATPDHWRLWGPEIDGRWAFTDHPHQGEKGAVVNVRCPYGQVGDRPWVREAWAPYGDAGARWYKAGVPVHTGGVMTGWTQWDKHVGEKPDNVKWRSPHFMPRWAARITLEITGIRLERVQSISEADCLAEGIETDVHDMALVARKYGAPDEWFQAWSDELPNYAHYDVIAQMSYRSIWDSMHAKSGHGWDMNPWVWAISFKQVRP